MDTNKVGVHELQDPTRSILSSPSSSGDFCSPAALALDILRAAYERLQPDTAHLQPDEADALTGRDLR